MALLSALLLIAGGCSHPSTAARGSGSPRPAAAPVFEEDRRPLDAATEQRIRAAAHFAAGVSAEVNDRPKEATEFFLKSVEEDPAHAQLVIEVARRFLQQSQPARAIALLQKATALPTATAGMYALLGVALADSNRPSEALQAYEAALRLDGADVLATRNLYQLHIDERRPADALAVLERAAKVESDSPVFWVELAGLEENFMRLQPETAEASKKRALAALNRAASLDPQEIFVVQKLAEALFGVGDYARAAKYYEELQERVPALPGTRERIAEAYLRQGDPEKAVEQLKLVLRQNPSNAQVASMLGSLHFQAGRPKEAASCFEKAIAVQPGMESAYYDLAAARIATDEPVEALTILDKARRRFKPNFTVEYYAAIACMQSKEYGLALRRFAEAEVLAKAGDPARLDARFYFQLGSALERKGDIAEAERSFRKSLELSPESAQTLNYLGYMWAEQGVNLQEALQFIERALAKDPENEAYLDSMAWVLFKLGRAAEARPWIDKALAGMKEPDETLLDHAGDIYEAVGDKAKAAEFWARSLQVEPDDKVKRKLDRVGPAAPRP